MTGYGESVAGRTAETGVAMMWRKPEVSRAVVYIHHSWVQMTVELDISGRWKVGVEVSGRSQLLVKSL